MILYEAQVDLEKPGGGTSSGVATSLWRKSEEAVE